MVQLNLTWLKCEDERWCLLHELNLNDEHFELLAGVYIIWRLTDNSRQVLRAGQGYFRKRLHQHRWEEDIMAIPNSDVYVTWAALDAAHRDAVERYLIDTLKPAILLEPEPVADPTSVSLPW